MIPSPIFSFLHVPVSVASTVLITPPPTVLPLKDVNDIPLTRALLTQGFSDLPDRLYCSFRRQMRLVVHGGAVMVLRPSFSHHESTQGRRLHPTVPSYPSIAPSGFPMQINDFQTCIAETAREFGLGADWMNDHADVALSWATRVHHDSRPIARFLSDVTLIISQLTNKDSTAIRSSMPRRRTKML